MTTSELPASLAEIVEDFQSVPDPQRLELLLEFSDELPDLPERYDGHTEEMEQVIECQTPLFLAVELDRSGDHSADPLVQLYVAAPAEAPTSRGFASVLQQGVAGLPASTVLEAGGPGLPPGSGQGADAPEAARDVRSTRSAQAQCARAAGRVHR